MEAKNAASNAGKRPPPFALIWPGKKDYLWERELKTLTTEKCCQLSKKVSYRRRSHKCSGHISRCVCRPSPKRDIWIWDENEGHLQCKQIHDDFRLLRSDRFRPKKEALIHVLFGQTFRRSIKGVADERNDLSANKCKHTFPQNLFFRRLPGRCQCPGKEKELLILMHGQSVASSQETEERKAATGKIAFHPPTPVMQRCKRENGPKRNENRSELSDIWRGMGERKRDKENTLGIRAASKRKKSPRYDSKECSGN